MISTCPAEEDKVNTELCEKAVNDVTPDNLHLVTPAVYGDFIYKNHHCLLCNAHDVNATNVDYLIPQYRCYNDNIIAEADELYRVHGPSEIIFTFLITYCNPYTNTSGHALVIARAACNNVRSSDDCYSIQDADVNVLSDTCDVYGSKISQPDSVDDNVTVCATCENMGWIKLNLCIQDACCTDGVKLTFKSFAVLLDFRGGGDNPVIPVTCGPDQYHDVIQNTCVDRSACGQGHAMIDGECAYMNVTHTVPLVTLTGYNRAHVTFTYVTADDDDESLITDTYEKMLSFLQCLTGNDATNTPAFQKDLHCSHRASDAIADDVSPVDDLSLNVCVWTQTLTPIQETLPPSETFIDEAITNIRTILTSAEHSLTHATVEITNFAPETISDDVCPVGMLTEETDILFTSSGELVINGTGWKVDPHSAPSGFSLVIDQDSHTVQYFVLLCEPEILKCDAIHMDYDRLTVKGSDVIVASPSHDELYLKGGWFALLPDHRLLVCVEAIPAPSLYSHKEYIDSILTATALILSIIALAVTLVTYGLFPSMRTVPGLCVMNLSSAILLAQLFFLFAPHLAHKETVCMVLGCLQHYFWLGAFLWMNLMAVKVYRTFSVTRAMVSTENFRLYALYAWGVPFVFVTISLLASLFTKLDFRYGGSACWISGPVGLGLFFGGPLALVIVLNICLFVRTVIELRRTGKMTSSVNKNTDQTLFRACIRLSSVMGFTWIFGFLANVKHLAFCWYLFILFNALTGVFIFGAFVANSRVVGMYRKLVKDKTGEMTKSSQGSTRNSDVSSVSNLVN